MRIIIAGGGEIGHQFARSMSAGTDVVVIEDDAELLRPFDGLDVQIARGAPTNIETLRQIGLCADDKFVACSDSDERNIIACMAAKRIGGPRTFCFVSKEEYYESFRPDAEDDFVDIDEIVWPQFMLAQEIARTVLVPGAIDVEMFASGRIWLMEYRIDENSSLVGKHVTEINLPKRVLAVALIADGKLGVPRADTIFDPGDKVVFMGKRRPLTRFAQSVFQRGKSGVSQVTVIGGGTVGVALAKLLLQGGVGIKVIELDKHRAAEIASEVSDCMVLHGDGSDLGLLREEDIADSDVLVSVTSDDEKNLLGSLLAKQMGIPKIITRVNKPANIRLFEHVGIDVPLNARITAVLAVQNMLRGTSAQLLATLEQGKAQVLELVVPDDYPVSQVRKLPPVPGAIIGAVVRGWRTVVPHGDDYVKPGDHLLVVATQDAREAVERYFY